MAPSRRIQYLRLTRGCGGSSAMLATVEHIHGDDQRHHRDGHVSPAPDALRLELDRTVNLVATVDGKDE